MQSVSSRIWTRVAVSISYDDNDYTTGTSKFSVMEEKFIQNIFENNILSKFLHIKHFSIGLQFCLSAVPWAVPDHKTPYICRCQTRLDTRSKARRPIKVGIKGRGRSGTSRDSNPACQCCSSAHLVQCEPDEASSFTNPNVGPGTYAS